FDFSRGRLFTGELAFSTVVACVLCQRPWHLTSNDIESAATDDADLFIESRRRLELALRRLCPTARIACSATPPSFVSRRRRRSRCDLYSFLDPARQSSILAQ